MFRRDRLPEERGASDPDEITIVGAIEGIEHIDTEQEVSRFGGRVPEWSCRFENFGEPKIQSAEP